MVFLRLLWSFLFIAPLFAGELMAGDLLFSTAETGPVRFQRIDMDALTDDQVKFIGTFAGNEGALTPRFGPILAKAISWKLYCTSNETIVQNFREELEARRALMDPDNVVDVHYLIFAQGSFVGQMAVAGFTDAQPTTFSKTGTVKFSWGFMQDALTPAKQKIIMQKALMDIVKPVGKATVVCSMHRDNIAGMDLLLELGFTKNEYLYQREIDLMIRKVQIPTYYFYKTVSS